MTIALNRERCSKRTGFVLLEVLVSMTILAVAGTALIQCFKSSLEAERQIKQRSKALFLTQGKILDLEFMYYDMESVRRGRHTGDYRQEGSPQFKWEADVKLNRDRWAYEIQVTTYWKDYGREQTYSMATLVPLPRYDERLVR
ncbi:MAG: prepilin-type N-terminal cleavage/methylation domain-containing protein [bacterium]